MVAADQLRELAEPLVGAMFTDAKSAPYLCVDATGVTQLPNSDVILSRGETIASCGSSPNSVRPQLVKLVQGSPNFFEGSHRN